VNSISKESWRAVLSGLRHQQLPGAPKSAADRTPLSRFDSVVAAHDATNPSTRHRALTDEEVDRLAEAIVRQVRRRGPFMSLSDFVNRRLVPMEDEAGHKGALQAAIDEAGINDVAPLDATFAADTTRHPSGRALSAEGKAASAQSALGATSHLLQSDILNAIGHTLSARSDTFVIRAYGEAVGPDGRATTGAWLELTVQRFPDPVAGGTLEPNERAADYRSLHDLANPRSVDERFRARAWTTLTPRERTNRNFGRKFRVVGARWLAPNEV
jgi:Arc/MetJ-type ribon-helix-helix transcriptional regulator